MRRYLEIIMPTTAQFLACLIAPTVLTIFFVVAQYSSNFISTQGVDQEIVRNNILANLYVTGALQQSFNRFMDFAFWGVIAAIVILLIWAVSVARTSVTNHIVEEGFENFTQQKTRWHEHFIVVAFIKLVLIFTMLYAVSNFVVSAVPALAAGAALCVQSVTLSHTLSLLYGVLLMVLFQVLLVVSLRLFKHTQAD